MATINRLLVQSSQMTMRKEKDDQNYQLLIDLPADSSLVVHEFTPLDDEQAYVYVSVVDIVAQFEDDDKTPSEQLDG